MAHVPSQSKPSSSDYWRHIFARNPEFCSWRAPQQREVLEILNRYLGFSQGTIRVLDFGVGNLGLYRALDSHITDRIVLTGISESKQHDDSDELLSRDRIRIHMGEGLSPLAEVKSDSQDFVLCTYVFAYLSESMRTSALAEFARVLAPNGRLLLVMHHPQGQRAIRFQRSERYWAEAHLLYTLLFEAKYDQAAVQLDIASDAVNAEFAEDLEHWRYLSSYLKTAKRFLTAFCVGGRLCRTPASEAVADLQVMLTWVEREYAMTCKAFRPIQNPARNLLFPRELRAIRIDKCCDLRNGTPMANVLTGVKHRAGF